MKVIITGVTGFIGQEIASEFINNAFQVIGLTRAREVFDPAQQGVVFVQADITNYENLSKLENETDIDLMIHSAGLAHQFGETKKEEFDAVNFKGTENVLNSAVKLKVKHFILIGSTAVYGIPGKNEVSGKNTIVIDENTPTNPQTLYAESKLESERICRQICETNNIALTIFRLAPVIGEANVGNVARLISTIDKNRFVWIGDGTNLKSLIYKRDVALSCLAVAKKKTNKTEIFNLAAEPVRMKDFVNEIASRLNKKTLPISIPAFVLRGIFRANASFFKIKKLDKLSDTVEKWLSNDVYSADKIAQAYGFKPQTTVFEGLHKQIDYYKAKKVSKKF